MTLEEQAQNYLNRAQPYIDAGNGNRPLAAEITAFLGSNRDALVGMGDGWLVDQLDAAWGQLLGNAEGAPQASQSPSGAFVKSFVSDDSSLDNYLGDQAKATLSSWGSKAADAIGAGADSAARGLLSHPSMVAFGIVAAVLVAAWAYRSFK